MGLYKEKGLPLSIWEKGMSSSMECVQVVALT